MIARLVQKLKDDRGMTVLELVIASTLSLVILMSVFAMLDSATKTERGQQARHSAQLELRAAMIRLTKDTRQALSLSTTSNRSSRIDMQTLVNGQEQHVIFELAGGTLSRRSCVETGPTPSCAVPTAGAPLASNIVAGSNVFCYDPPVCALPAPLTHPRNVRFTLALHPDVLSGGPISLNTDVKLRNI